MVVIVMGVAGSGKTTIGRLLAESLGWSFIDGDDRHPQSNLDKMRRGLALTDEDREPWLRRLREEIQSWLTSNRDVVLACSSLKADYRARLVVDPALVRLVYLAGPYSLMAQRLKDRSGHFFPDELLASQYAALEEPIGALVVDASRRPDDIVQRVRIGLGLSSPQAEG
jgi:gluconokinase